MSGKRDRGFWRKVIRAFERSGLEQRVFCERQGIKLGTFQYWLYKVRRERNATTASTALVRVELAEHSHGGAPLEAALPGGVTLRIIPGTDPKYVAAVLSEVGNARC